LLGIAFQASTTIVFSNDLDPASRRSIPKGLERRLENVLHDDRGDPRLLFSRETQKVRD